MPHSDKSEVVVRCIKIKLWSLAALKQLKGVVAEVCESAKVFMLVLYLISITLSSGISPVSDGELSREGAEVAYFGLVYPSDS